MADIVFTTQQQQAIDSRRDRLVVSAAAGSGKTAVLVRRVVELLKDPRDPLSLSDMVVVTFTKAAASEMRSKIGDALHRQLLREPGNEHLRRQLALLPTARVQTVHAFCQELLREHFALCGIAPDFKLLDESESKNLRDEVLDRLLEEEYAAGRPTFKALCAATRENRGDRLLVRAILDVYEKLLSYPDPKGWLEQARTDCLADEPTEARWGKYVLAQARRRMAGILEAQARLDGLIAGNETASRLMKIQSDARREHLEFLQQALDADWDTARDALELIQFGQFTNSTKLGADKPLLRSAWDEVKNGVKYIQKLLSSDSANIVQEQGALSELVGELCHLVDRLMEELAREKQRRCELDFSDLEHLTFKLLKGQNGIADKLSGHIRELLVDEYQDTNQLQDEIFKLLTPKRGGLFLVGDVKQSIYRFRMAEPEIFVRRIDQSPPEAPQGVLANRSLALNRNFRSTPQVLDLCNFAFSRLMSREFGGIHYGESEQLHYDREGPRPPVCCEAWLLDLGKDAAGEKGGSVETESAYVASRISRMLREETVADAAAPEGRRPVRPEDIAILLSSYTNKEYHYSAALQALNIPVAAGSRGDYWNSPEILTVLSFLRVIDNRRQDIELTALMNSAIYRFTPDELAAVRVADMRAPYSDALAAAAVSMPKAAALLADLDRYADLACDMTVSQLLRLLYEEKNIPALFSAMDRGDMRRDNLEQLLNLAIRYEQHGARGLYRFLSHLERQIAENKMPPAAQGRGGVQIMSIHKSKGLEYPIVFLPDLNKRFNEDDARLSVLVHKDMGISMKIRDTGLHRLVQPQSHVAMAKRIEEELRAEELRKLYVAMTRAKEKLILTAAVSNSEDFLKKRAEEFSEDRYNPAIVAERTNMAQWVFGALLHHPGGGGLRAVCPVEVSVAADGRREDLQTGVIHWTDLEQGIRWTGVDRQAMEDIPAEEAAALLAKMELEYPHMEASALPSKLTPTGLKKMIPDAAELYEGRQGREIRLYRQPTGESGSARERGKADHLLLSCLPLEECATAEGLQSALERLRAAGQIPQGVFDLADAGRLLKFTAGPLGRRVLQADKYLREYEFGVLLPPEQLLGGPETGEQILVNGVIDLLLFEGDSMTVIDFKTDNIRPGAEAQAAAQHRLQLEIYGKAATEIFGLPVKEWIVFFLRTGGWHNL